MVRQVGVLQGLTHLELHTTAKQVHGQLVPAQLAAMLQPLTGLQQLKLMSGAVADLGGRYGLASAGEVPGFESYAVAALLQAIGGLRELGGVCVKLQMQLTKSAAKRLHGRLQELLPVWMLAGSELEQRCRVAVDLLEIDT
jgi:hypothetical protein